MRDHMTESQTMMELLIQNAGLSINARPTPTAVVIFVYKHVHHNIILYANGYKVFLDL